MSSMTKTLWAGAAGVAFCVAPLSGQAAGDAAMRPVAASALAWSDFVMPGFDPGAKITVVHGDPAAAGPYTVRMQFPDGYNFPPHWHPMAENVTVLSGTFLLAMGDTRDNSKLREYQPGDYLFIPAKHPHFGGVRGVTVIQLHGSGPFDVILARAATD
jgi:quercetin dioxygenase-like cupin family protein